MSRLPSISLLKTLGQRASGARQRRIEASPQWSGTRFRNPEGATMESGPGAVWEWLTGGSTHRKPGASGVPIERRTREDFATPASGLRLTWMGHGTTLIEIGGRRFLVDPLWSGNASPGRLFGVKRFHDVPLALDDLPPLDAVLITHDHYDHLDAETVTALADRVPRWICPLGVGARLEGWGVPPEAVTELDWWDATEVGACPGPRSGGVTVTATPARHFSGRFLTDRDSTLWCGFVLASGESENASARSAGTGRPAGSPLQDMQASGAGGEHRVLVGGDGGYSAAFREIGERLGPFDVALMEIGAYNGAWADIHMGPEQAVQAALDARATLLLPVHWGTFDLALHGWTEPAERVLVAAQEAGLPLALPKPGESIDPSVPPEARRWWPELPWATAAEAPVVSSGVVPPPDSRPAPSPEASGATV